MPVGTERRIFGIFPVPFATTFEPLTRSIQVIPTLKDAIDEHLEGVGEIPCRTEAWAHPIVVGKKPKALAVSIEQRRRIPRSGYTNTKPEYELVLNGDEINTFYPLRLRTVKDERSRLFSFVSPRIIVYRP